MTQLTEERFEQILSEKLKPLATRQDVREGIEELARMVNDGFDDMRERLDVTEQLHSFERKFQKLEEALHIKL